MKLKNACLASFLLLQFLCFRATPIDGTIHNSKQLFAESSFLQYFLSLSKYSIPCSYGERLRGRLRQFANVWNIQDNSTAYLYPRCWLTFSLFVRSLSMFAIMCLLTFYFKCLVSRINATSLLGSPWWWLPWTLGWCRPSWCAGSCKSHLQSSPPLADPSPPGDCALCKSEKDIFTVPWILYELFLSVSATWKSSVWTNLGLCSTTKL